MSAPDELSRELAARLSAESVVRAQEPLARRTTIRIGGPAEVYVEPASEADLVAAWQWARAKQLPITVLGRGSNLLVRDHGVRGVVVHLGHACFREIRVEETRVFAGAGAKLKDVANSARRAGLTGLEFLEGIPGSVGGGLRMNAGAMGSQMFETVERVRFLTPDGEVRELPAAEIPVRYRCCDLLRTHVALAAVMTGRLASAEEVGGRMKQYSGKRWESQPAQPSAGCIFKNPAVIPAGKLIQELGLKGTRHGGAMISDIHGNFIVNTGGASAADVLALIDLVKQRAHAERGIELETEVEILGEP